MSSHASRARLFASLSCLLVAQFVVAVVVRWLLWPQAKPVAVLRTFAREDIIVIGGFGAVTLVLAALFGANQRGRAVVAVVAWAAALIHLVLLAVNYTAVTWLRAPLTLPWLQMAGAGDGDTPLLMVRSVTSPGTFAGLAGAIALPFALLAVVRRTRLQAWAGSPWPLALFTALSGGLAIMGVPGKASQWQDALSNPAVAMWQSFRQIDLDSLRLGQGDGQIADYALRPAARTSPVPTRPDILVVVLESVGAKAVRENLQDLPTLARLMREGTVFPNASVNVSASSQSMFSLMYSNHPRLAFGFKPRDDSGHYPEAFLKTLRRAGYSTNFIQGGDFAFQNADRMLDGGDSGLRSDYRTIPCKIDDRSTNISANDVYMPDRCVFGAFESWFVAQSGPRAAIIWPHYTHFPYDFDDQRKVVSGSKAAYIAALRAVDRNLGQSLDRLAASGARPVVAIVGDHGDAFGEHGFVMHGQTVFQEEIGIPMILAGPGVPAGKIDQRLAQIVDIAPTLVSIAGAGRPCGWQGLSLFGPETRKRAYAFALMREPMVGFREGNRKFTLGLRDGAMARYDLAADPAEQHPLPVSAAEAKAATAAIAGWASYNERLYRNTKRCGGGA